MKKWYLRKDNGNVASDAEIKANNIGEAIAIMQDEYTRLHPSDQKELWSLGVYHADDGDDYENADAEAWLVTNGKLNLEYVVTVAYFRDGQKERTIQFDAGKCEECFDVCDYWQEIPAADEDGYAEVTISFYAEGADKATAYPLKEVTELL